MKYRLYKKEKKEIVPVTGNEENKLAKARLSDIFEKRQELRIPSRFIEAWENVALFQTNGDIAKANSILFPNEKSAFALNNTLNDLTAKEWLPETVTVFSQKGLGAGNKDAQIEKQHPAPFSFQDVGRLIQFYSKENDRVLDPFSGVASTAKACAFNNRVGYGIELNPKYHELAKKRIEIEVPDEQKAKKIQSLINGNSKEEIKNFKNDFFDFIVTSPPYWNILETVDHKGKERVINNLDHKYGEDTKDFSNIEDYTLFLETLSTFFNDCARVLKKGRYLCVIVSDFRKKDKYYTFHADLANELEKKGSFVLKGVRILYQRHKGIYPYGYPFSFVPNMHHQNVLIFQNIKKK
ncbi:MAG: DNA methyltransferase [Chitinophagales bacterium]